MAAEHCLNRLAKPTIRPSGARIKLETGCLPTAAAAAGRSARIWLARYLAGTDIAIELGARKWILWGSCLRWSDGAELLGVESYTE